jgi:hypothetical protein
MRFTNNNSKMNERQTSVRRQAGEADPAHHASLKSNFRESERRNNVRGVAGGHKPHPARHANLGAAKLE